MKKCLLLLFLISIVSACGEHAPDVLIPDGTYVSSTSQEEITVNGKDIHFMVYLDQAHTRLLDRSCQYSVWPDGTIFPLQLRSSEFVMGVGRFDWRWDGKSIVQIDPRAASRDPKLFKLQVNLP